MRRNPYGRKGIETTDDADFCLPSHRRIARRRWSRCYNHVINLGGGGNVDMFDPRNGFDPNTGVAHYSDRAICSNMTCASLLSKRV